MPHRRTFHNQASQSVYNRGVERQPQPTAAPLVFEAAPLDVYARRLTTGLAYLGGLLELPLLFAYLANLRWDGLIVPVALGVALAIFLLLTYAAQPRCYELDNERLIVRRRWLPPITTPFTTITGVSSAAYLADVPRRGLRFAFNAGIFGYQGPFRLAPYGEVFFIATNRERLVSVAREGRPPLIISPARPRAFIEALNERRTRHALAALEQAAEQASQQRSAPVNSDSPPHPGFCLRACRERSDRL